MNAQMQSSTSRQNDPSTISLTVFSNPDGKGVGKSYEIINGKPTKKTIGNPFAARGEVRTFTNAAELATFVSNLDGSAYLCPGVPRNGLLAFKVTTKAKSRDGFIARSKENFKFLSAPGIGLLDHDWRPETPERLHMNLAQFEVCLAQVLEWPMNDICRVSYPSSSSHIECEDGTANTGLRGHHNLVLVEDASDWGRALDCIHQRLVISGFGWVLIGGNGSQYIRSIVDNKVGKEPNRAIYSGKASLGKGLRYSDERSIYYSKGVLLDTRRLVPPLTFEEQGKFDRIVQSLLVATADEAVEVRRMYREERQHKMIAQGATRQAAVQAIESAGNGQLEAPWQLTLADGEVITVRDILADSKAFNGRDCLDPLEPDYQGGRTVAKIYTNRGECFISSYAHGGDGKGGPTVYILRPSMIDDFKLYDFCEPVTGEGNSRSPLKTQKTLPTRFRLLSGTDLVNAPPMRWLVRGVLPADGLAALFGPSGSGKSFLVLDMAASVASGFANWFGQQITQCPVTYLALEGEAGLSKRVKAWSHQRNQPIPSGLRFITQPFDLVTGGDVLDLAKAIQAAGNIGGIVILDTLNRAAAGLDENSSAEMGKIISAAKQLQLFVGGLVLLVHHTGKDASKGLRGHSSLYAALDSAIEVSKTSSSCEWRVAKSKDDATGKRYSFKLAVVELGLDDKGEEISSCVAIPAGEAISGAKVKLPTMGNQKTAFEALRHDFQTSAEFDKVGAPPKCPCLLFENAVTIVRAKIITDDKHRKQRAQEAIKALVASGIYGMEGGWLWLNYTST